MSLDDGHHLYERRRLRRRVGFWRLVALLAVVGAAAALVWQATPRGPYIARHAIAGMILDDPARDDLMREIADDPKAVALILRIDSPGGSVAGSEALYDSIRAVAAQKPVVAVMGEVAASGGYIAALAADRIIARGNTITGSIGVIAEFPNVERLLDTLGIDFARVASAPLKAEPSPLREPSPEAIAAQQALIDDAYRWFVGLVAERRALSDGEARALGDGRVYSGRQAVEAGLIDALGAEADAVTWLEVERGIAPDLPVRDAEVADEALGWFEEITGARLERLMGRLLHGPRLMAILR